MFEDIHVRELWVTLLLIPVFVIISLYFFACDTSSHQVCVVVLYATAAATAALRWSCSLSLAHLLSRSAPLAFWCLVRWLFDTTLQYTLPTHAREHQPVWFVLLHTGLDWTGLDCALRSLRSARRSLVIVG